MPLTAREIVGALSYLIEVNNSIPASCVIDTGSGISLISKHFIRKYDIQCCGWDPPLLSVVTGATFSLPLAAEIIINILGFSQKGLCGVIDNFAFDILLGMDFLKNTPLLLDFSNLTLFNPAFTGKRSSSSFSEISRPVSVPQFLNFVPHWYVPRADNLGQPVITEIEDSVDSLAPTENPDQSLISQSTSGTGKYDSSKTHKSVVKFSHLCEINGVPELSQDKILFDSAEYGGGNSEDEADDREEIWLPSRTGTKPESSPEIDESIWTSLNFSNELTSEQKQTFLSLLRKYPGIFPTKDNKLGFCDLIYHKIDTGNADPVKEQLRHFGSWQQKQIALHVKELLDLGVISPCQSDWAANVIIVKKKDGSTRMVVDSRPLNKVTVKDSYSMGNIQNMLDSLHGAKIFTHFDLYWGYHNIPIAPEDAHKTAFVVPSAPGFAGGLFQYNRMSFGLCNAPATFCRVVDRLFGDFKQDFCLLYIDDFFVYSSNFEDHLIHVERVLQRLENSGLKIKPSKCFFGLPKITFLGHQISAAGIAPDPEKVSAILKFPRPVNLRTLRGFLGTTNYFHRFIPDYAEIASPLVYLLMKNVPFIWTETQENAFEELKRRLTSAPILAHFNNQIPSEVHTDASAIGLGAVLI